MGKASKLMGNAHIGKKKLERSNNSPGKRLLLLASASFLASPATGVLDVEDDEEGAGNQGAQEDGEVGREGDGHALGDGEGREGGEGVFGQHGGAGGVAAGNGSDGEGALAGLFFRGVEGRADWGVRGCGGWRAERRGCCRQVDNVP